MGAETKLYEIINPSDPYTMRAESDQIAAAAGILLGQGRYGVHDSEDKDVLPVLLFGGAEEAVKEILGVEIHELGNFIDANSAAIADALDSVLIGHFGDRETYEKGLELIDDEAKRKQWREYWHEERRSSLNYIGKKAWKLAALLREQAVEVATHD